MKAEDPGELTAAAAGIPFVSITGDDGPAQPNGDDTGSTRRRDVAVWADSPWTLAVGGSFPSSPTSSRLISNSGAGRSRIFARPAYQNRVASATHSGMRSVPDITMDGHQGTSEAAPMMAGVLALATQANGGHDLGPINTALYDTLGPKGAADGVTDITKGSNRAPGRAHVPGFSAGKGFDIASGWGTIDAPRFIPALVHATRASDDEHAARTQASAALTALRTAIHLTPLATTSQLTATGFVPRLPVTLSIDGRHVSTLHADTHGDVTDTINPTALHLSAGAHTVTLSGMLLTVAGQLTTP